MRRFLKELYFTFAQTQPLPEERAVILMYHSLSGPSAYFSAITPAAFEQQMAYLAENHRKVVPLADLVRRLAAGEPLGGAISITFDDGYEDNFTIAAPILRRHGFPATIFVTTDLIGRVDEHGLRQMSEAQLRELEASGVISIEPHSMTHPKLSRLSIGEAHAEIGGSKKILERLLSKECQFFAYPKGDFSAETQQAVRDGGFDAAVSVVERSVGPESDLFALPRHSIDRSTSFAQFRGKISAAADRYERMKSWL